MDICDAIEEADANDPAMPPVFARRLADVKDIEATALKLAEHLKYPVDHRGHVLDMNHLPDVLNTLTYHLTKLGWRWNPEKALVKPRKVIGAGFYEDLVTYVPIQSGDEPLIVPRPEAQEPWSVKLKVNETYEERPQ